MKKLLWIGDAACPSGFARVTHEVLDTLRHSYDVTVLGINYRGDPHPYPYPIYTAMGDDYMGVWRLIWMCDFVKPDVIVILNDPWNIPFYTNLLKKFPDYAKVPVVGSVAVDGKNCRGAGLNDLALAIFWTQFGADEAKAGGYTGPAEVIPLGVDLNTFNPRDKQEARAKRLPLNLPDVFVVGNVNRNQPRKRWDLTIQYFADWVKSRKIQDAYLYLHCAPTGDTGCNVAQLAKYYGVLDRLWLMEPPVFYGISEEEMVDTYNCFDVQISTTQGEGFGLTTLEGMACGIPQIVPAWAALGDWPKGAVWEVRCTGTAIGPPYVNVIGGVPDKDLFIAALDALYHRSSYRKQNGEAALERAQQARFRWSNIGKEYNDALTWVLAPKFAEASI